MAHTVAFRVSLAASLRLTPEPFFSHKHFIAENKLLTCSAHLPLIYPGDGTSMSSQPILSYRRESRANRAPNRRTENYQTKPFLAATGGNQATYQSRKSSRPMAEAKARGAAAGRLLRGRGKIPNEPIVSRNPNKSSHLCFSVEPAMALGEAIGKSIGPGSNRQTPPCQTLPPEALR